MVPPERAGWSPLQILLWASAALVVAVLLGPHFVSAFRPPSDVFTDFSQEWLSARNYQAGLPVYTDQTQTLYRHTGMVPEQAGDMLPWNAHPPASILLALPLAALDYRDALLVWNLATGVLFVAAVVLVVRELGMPVRPASVFPVVVLVVLCHPLNFQLVQGQLNFVLAFLLTAAWAADRRGHPGWAGAAVGTAAAFKLFPAFLFLYFVATRRWAALAAGVAAFAALNGLALGVFGVEAFRTYAREVVPSVVGYQTSWRNVSLTGFWLRLFDPHEQERVAAAVHAPAVGRAVLAVLRVAVVAAAAVACWRATTVEARDRGFAACLVGMLLVSPIVWSHYFLLLLLPLALLWMRLPPGVLRVGLWVALVVMWLPENFTALITLGPDVADAMSHNKHRVLSPWACFAATAPAHFALLGLFCLTLAPSAGRSAASDDWAWEAGGETDEERLNRRLFGPVGGP